MIGQADGQMVRQTEGQADQMDRQMVRQTAGQTDSQTGRWTERWSDRQMDRQADGQTYRWSGRHGQTDNEEMIPIGQSVYTGDIVKKEKKGYWRP